jgi:DNA-binding CsgD family transcriptional regulator
MLKLIAGLIFGRIRNMETWNIISYAGLVILGSISAWTAWKLFRRYSLSPLLFLFFFVVASLTAGLLEIMGDFMARETLGRWLTPEVPMNLITWVFYLLSYPFSILAVYSFILMTVGWAKKKVHLVVKITFFSLQISMILIWFILGYKSTVNNSVNIHNLQLIFTGINTSLMILLLAIMTIIWLPKSDFGFKRGLNIFAIIYSFFLILNYVMISLIGTFEWACAFGLITTFFLHLPPLLFLTSYLRTYTNRQPLQPLSQKRLQTVIDRYNITDREAQIVKMLLQGKSYRDIEDKLFISLKTVKSHTYNIYRKTKVKSRWQLLNLVQQHSSESSSSSAG